MFAVYPHVRCASAQRHQSNGTLQRALGTSGRNVHSAPLYVIEGGSNHEVDSREDIREKAMKHSLLAQSMKLCSRD